MKWAEIKSKMRSVEMLAFYLEVSQGTLFRLSRTASHFYRQKDEPKSDGGVRTYLIPSGELKRVQSLIHKKVLLFAPFHKAIHGYRRKRGQVTAALPHVEKPMLLTADIEKFFPNIRPSMVYDAFRQVGISDSVSRLLVDLCTHNNQLPQGAPTSPLISNLIWSRPARRIQGFADQQHFDLTILGDDAFVSGAPRAKKFKNLVRRIIQEEGFSVNERKTRALPSTGRQVTAGLVVNKKPNVKKEYKRALRKMLHSCASNECSDVMSSEIKVNKASLAGKIAFVKHINPAQGQRFQAEFERINSRDSKKANSEDRPGH
ncbi:MAG TPA: reverse transcriptase family protein [Nitrospira sp.]|nr:reverse transcriptase family protein [Nitrospira sp.]